MIASSFLMSAATVHRPIAECSVSREFRAIEGNLDADANQNWLSCFVAVLCAPELSGKFCYGNLNRLT